MKNKTLLVGCGGSGITTLIRLNELLAGNSEMRQRIREDVSYLVIDTEADKVATFSDAIARQMGGAGLPAMRLVQMTSGFVDLDEIVQPNIDEQHNEEALALLKKHWWCAPDKRGINGNGRAFRAISVAPITDGAGQCSPVSFMSAWNYLPKLEEDVMGLLEEIQLRNTDEDNPLANLRVYIVTGLAGGTGRGCWNLVAFKIRQSLARFGVRTDPIGVFFDATCFQSVWPGSPGEAKSMRMNALTGISELSAWMRLVKAPEDAYRYALPDLSRPDVKGRTDVIKVPPTGDKEKSPVNAAYLIFGNNGACRLKDNNQYHEMAAAALYSLVASDTFIGAKVVNLPENVRSFAATTFEVETVGIRRYMESLVHLEYAQRLCRSGEGTAREALALVGDWREVPAKETFFATTGLFVGAEVSESALGSGEKAATNVLERLMGTARDEIGFDEKTGQFHTWKSIEQALKDQDEDGAKKRARRALVEAGGKAEDILDACLTSLDTGSLPMGKESLGRTLRDTVRAAFYSEGKEDPAMPGIRMNALEPSIARARTVAKLLQTAFKTSKDNVVGPEDSPLRVSVENGRCSDAEECARLFLARIDVMSDRKASDFFKKFSDAEIRQLGDEFKKYQRVALFFQIQGVLKELFVQAEKIAKALDDALKTLEDGLSDVSEVFNTELCMDFKRPTRPEVFDKLFTKDDDEAVFQALQGFDSYTKVFRRLLKPVTTSEELEALVAKPDLNEKPIVDQLKKELDNLIGDAAGKAYSSSEDARDAIRKAFVGLVRDNVGLPLVNGTDFMSANFPFMKVLASNREKWNRLLAHRWNSVDARGKVLDLFRTYLGVAESDLVKTPGGGSHVASRLPEARELMRHIVVSMISTCRPWMQLDGGASMQYLSTIALVPVELGAKEKELYDADIKAKYGEKRPVRLHHRGDDEGLRLPEDRIVLFAATGIIPPKDGDRNPFSFIGSLRYWRDPELTELLENAEKKSGEGYFEWLEDEPGRGFWAELDRTYGMVSPLFLTIPDLANKRWRPWKPLAEDLQEEDERMKQSLAALLQGLMGTGVGEELKKAVEAKGWTGFPLLAMTGKGKGAESLVFQRNCNTDALAWKEGEVLGTTLKNAFEFLMGRGRPNETREVELAEQSRHGTQIRKALLAEKEAFEKVLAALAEESREAIRTALEDFLAGQARTARNDTELWEELYRLLKAEAES